MQMEMEMNFNGVNPNLMLNSPSQILTPNSSLLSNQSNYGITLTSNSTNLTYSNSSSNHNNWNSYSHNLHYNQKLNSNLQNYSSGSSSNYSNSGSNNNYSSSYSSGHSSSSYSNNSQVGLRQSGYYQTNYYDSNTNYNTGSSSPTIPSRPALLNRRYNTGNTTPQSPPMDNMDHFSSHLSPRSRIDYSRNRKSSPLPHYSSKNSYHYYR